MKLHPAVTKFKSEIKRVATLRGLAQIDFDEPYSLYKTGAKNASRMGYPDEMLALRQACFLSSEQKTAKKRLFGLLVKVCVIGLKPVRFFPVRKKARFTKSKLRTLTTS